MLDANEPYGVGKFIVTKTQLNDEIR